MNHPCRPFAADLDGLAAGVLPPERARAVQAHLDSCADCRGRHAQTLIVCAALSAAGRAAEPPDAAVWRLRRRVRAATAAPASGLGGRWRTATAAVAVALACVAWFAGRSVPPTHAPDLVEAPTAVTPAVDPPLTLLACERAAARSDAALDQMLSRDAARPHAVPGESSLRAFSPTVLAALEHDDHLP